MRNFVYSFSQAEQTNPVYVFPIPKDLKKTFERLKERLLGFEGIYYLEIKGELQLLQFSKNLLIRKGRINALAPHDELRILLEGINAFVGGLILSDDNGKASFKHPLTVAEIMGLPNSVKHVQFFREPSVSVICALATKDVRKVTFVNPLKNPKVIEALRQMKEIEICFVHSPTNPKVIAALAQTKATGVSFENPPTDPAIIVALSQTGVTKVWFVHPPTDPKVIEALAQTKVTWVSFENPPTDPMVIAALGETEVSGVWFVHPPTNPTSIGALWQTKVRELWFVHPPTDPAITAALLWAKVDRVTFVHSPLTPVVHALAQTEVMEVSFAHPPQNTRIVSALAGSKVRSVGFWDLPRVAVIRALALTNVTELRFATPASKEVKVLMLQLGFEEKGDSFIREIPLLGDSKSVRPSSSAAKGRIPRTTASAVLFPASLEVSDDLQEEVLSAAQRSASCPG